MGYAMLRRGLLITQKGRIGFTAKNVEIGVKLCVIFGYACLVMLWAKDNRYVVVGDACVDGLRAVDGKWEVEDGKYEVEKFNYLTLHFVRGSCPDSWVANVVYDLIKGKGGEELKALEIELEGTRTINNSILEQLPGPAMDGKKKKRRRAKSKKSERLESPGATDERPDQVDTVVYGPLNAFKGVKPANQIVNFGKT